MADRLQRLLHAYGPLSARALRRTLDCSSGELLVLLRQVGAVRQDRDGRVLWRLA